MDLLPSLSVFLRVTETGSFSRAADSLGMTRSMVTRRIQALEEDLGTKLFFRSTRKVTLSSEGMELLVRARDLLAKTNALYVELRDQAGKPLFGSIRIASSVIIGWVFLQKVVQEFLDANPGVTIELVTEDQPIKMVDEGIDLAFKVGNRLPDFSVAKKIGVVQNYFCASPEFLKKSRKISRPSDLEKVNFLANTYLGSSIQLVGPEGKKATVNVRGRFISRNTFINCRSCLRGDGVAMLPAEFAQNYIDKGELVRVLPEWEGEEYGFYALYPDRALSRPARAFLELTVKRMEELSGHVYGLVRQDDQSEPRY